MKFVRLLVDRPAHSFAEILAHCLGPGGVLDQEASLEFVVTLHLCAQILGLILAILQSRDLLTSSSSNRIYLFLCK